MGYKRVFNPVTGRHDFVIDDVDINLKDPVDTFADLPVSGNGENDMRFVKDTDKAYVWTIPNHSGAPSDWQEVGGGGISEVSEDTTPELGGELDAGEHSIVFTRQTITSSGGNASIDWRNSNKAVITLTENTTFAFTDPSNSCNLTLMIKQDGSGGHTRSFPANVKWAGATEPTWSTGINEIDVVSFYYDKTDDVYYGMAGINFS